MDSSTRTGRISEGIGGVDPVRFHRAALQGRRHTSPGQRPGITSTQRKMRAEGAPHVSMCASRLRYAAPLQGGKKRGLGSETRGFAPGWNAMPRWGIQRLTWMAYVSHPDGTDYFGHAPIPLHRARGKVQRPLRSSVCCREDAYSKYSRCWLE